MKFKILDIRNFLSISEGKIDLDQGGLIGIFGRNKDSAAFSSNGSGKSAIWDALSYVLFDKLLRNISKTSIQRTGSLMVQVSLVFETEDSKQYEITRGRNNSGPYLYLKEDGKDVTKLTQSDTQQEILSLVGMDWQTFTVAVIFGQDTFRFAAATDKEQKQIFDKLLDIQIYDKALEVCKSYLSSANAKLDGFVVERDKHSFLVKNLQDNLANQKVILDRQEKQRIDALNSLKAQLVSLENKIIANPAKHQAEIEECRHQLEGIRDKVVEVEKLKLEVQRIDSQLQDAQREFNTLQQKESRLQLNLKVATKINNCGLCKQPIDKDEHERQIKLISDELAMIKADMTDYQSVLDDPDIKATVGSMKASIAKDDWPLKKQQLLSKISVLQMNVDSSSAEQSRKGAQIASITAKIDALDRPNQIGDSDAQNKITAAEKAINELNAEIDQIRFQIEDYRFWERGFGPGGIRSFLLDSVTPALNEAANRYGQILLDGSVKIEFSTQQQLKTGEKKDRFEVKATNIYGAEVYEGNSAGERQRIDICIALALHILAMSRNARGINFLVFDEAFERLDRSGCERVTKLLRQISKEKGSIFVVTHLEEMQSFFDTTIEIQKEDGKSTIKSERSLEQKNIGMELKA